ncbi:DUF805 domain-containing protein [Xenorhabdus bovienii]|uniref:DUF805 domain-containing protein n=1 Tax=Xenorhabdus bovienii TaxID=40576 RepID=UPI0004D8CB97|nr:DUF805 domain-containing protein [Xenorhabdus bovienii]CDG87380.1 conserved hypothetical protein; putative inner membrane protein [Xenorhabdus bovienii str. feltiae France]CDG94342.1 conserved hypothetical protein; putative inner membrane protein [Xenorhabdus bovienii str. feltiae Florida]
MNWYLNVLKNYANFSGRARRKEYWMFTLFNYIAIIVLCVLGSAISETLGVGLLGIYAIVIFIPSLAVMIRRLHDTNRSGWWFLLAFVPILSIALLVFFCLEGSKGDNDFGANPKGML